MFVLDVQFKQGNPLFLGAESVVGNEWGVDKSFENIERIKNNTQALASSIQDGQMVFIKNVEKHWDPWVTTAAREALESKNSWVIQEYPNGAVWYNRFKTKKYAYEVRANIPYHGSYPTGEPAKEYFVLVYGLNIIQHENYWGKQEYIEGKILLDVLTLPTDKFHIRINNNQEDLNKFFYLARMQEERYAKCNLSFVRQNHDGLKVFNILNFMTGVKYNYSNKITIDGTSGYIAHSGGGNYSKKFYGQIDGQVKTSRGVFNILINATSENELSLKINKVNELQP